MSAWLPAAFFTISLTLLVQFHLQRSMSISNAIRVLMKDQLTVLILAVPVLVCATLVTQAFSFEAIRFLEGYWRRPVIATVPRYLMIRFQASRKRRLRSKRIKASARAFRNARTRWLRNYSSDIVNALELDAIEENRPTLSDDDEAKLSNLDWWGLSEPWQVARVDHLKAAESEYPRAARVLPTRLGNLIRASEDRLQNAGQELESFALRRRSTVSIRIRQQHDQFRTRLDMYSILTVVSLSLTWLTPALLLGHVGQSNPLWIAGIALAFALVAFASYQAAIASARGYLVALRQMDDALGSVPVTRPRA